MNSIKELLDKELENVTLNFSITEIEKKHKEKKRIKAYKISLSSLSIVLILFLSFNLISSYMFDNPVPLGFSLTAYALEDSSNAKEISAVKTAISVKTKGVDKQLVTNYYTENGEYYSEGDDYHGEITESENYVISVKPINFRIQSLEKQIESFDISCSDNGYLYNQKDYGTAQSFENLKYSNLQDVQWMPNCEKLDLEIREKTGVDTAQVQLNISDSEKVSDALDALLKTESDYNTYFSDRVTVIIHYKDSTEEITTIEITLDENGYFLVNYI